MRPRERRESREQDLFRSRLDQIIDTKHALVKLARTIDWRFLEEKFGAVYKDGAGQPPLPTRLMAGLAILKHTYRTRRGASIASWACNCATKHPSVGSRPGCVTTASRPRDRTRPGPWILSMIS